MNMNSDVIVDHSPISLTQFQDYLTWDIKIKGLKNVI